MRLDGYSVGEYTPGASKFKQIAWFFVGAPLLRSYLLPFSALKVEVLRLFGAKVGQGVRIKPGVNVKFPWRLVLGEFTWVGEGVWIDNLAPVEVGSHSCISQGVYLCTGNHDWTAENFDLKISPIRLEDRVWLAAKSIVAPGVHAAEGAVLAMGSLACGKLDANAIYQGNPAKKIADRS